MAGVAEYCHSRSMFINSRPQQNKQFQRTTQKLTHNTPPGRAANRYCIDPARQEYCWRLLTHSPIDFKLVPRNLVGLAPAIGAAADNSNVMNKESTSGRAYSWAHAEHQRQRG